MKASEIALLIFILACAVSGPLMVIWAVNTLFSTEIEYTILNWFATAILMAIVPAGVTSGSRK